MPKYADVELDTVGQQKPRGNGIRLLSGTAGKRYFFLLLLLGVVFADLYGGGAVAVSVSVRVFR